MADRIGSQSGTSDEYHSMTDSLGSQLGTSDQYHDPFCEPCEETRGRNVKIECFSKNCNQYLCIECHTTHGSLKATRGHVIQTGDDMPKSMADKPPRYDACDDHPKHLKDQFCCDHGTLVCSTCCSTSHAKCNTNSLADTCQYVQQNEVNTLCDVNKTYKSQLLKFLSSVDKHGEKLTEQKKTMLKDAQTRYDKILAEINRSFQNVKAVIKAECGSQAEAISEAKQEINAQMTRADTEINFTDKLRGKPITVKSFLSLQESVSNTRESVAAIESLKDSLSLISLSFEPSKDVQKLISQTFSFGALNKHGINVGFDVTLPDIKFPMSLKTSAAGAVGTTKQQGITRPGAQRVKPTQQASLGQIKAKEIGTFNVKIRKDNTVCDIHGITITPSGQRLVVDYNNKKVKLFSQDMKFLSSVSVPVLYPNDITMVNDRDAVVTVELSLVFLEVTGKQLRIKHTIETSFDCIGITYSNGKLFVSDCTTIHALDLQGTELWSVGRRSLFKTLFKYAEYVSSNSDGRWIAVTDSDKNTITILDTNNGAVITSRKLKHGAGPEGVSVDMSDKIFVCLGRNIVALSSDLKHEHVLFNMETKIPQAIAYDKMNHQLIISHTFDDSLRCLQLS